MVTVIAEQERHQGRRSGGPQANAARTQSPKYFRGLDNDLRSDPKEGNHTDDVQKLHPASTQRMNSGTPRRPPTRGRPGTCSTPTHYSGSPSPERIPGWLPTIPARPPTGRWIDPAGGPTRPRTEPRRFRLCTEGSPDRRAQDREGMSVVKVGPQPGGRLPPAGSAFSAGTAHGCRSTCGLAVTSAPAIS